MISGKIIFISPLDWGLGHATRCVPLIRELSENNTVVIGVSYLNAPFFNKYFPDLQKAEVPSYGIKYSKKIPVWLKILSQWPKINSVIKSEKERLEKIIQHYKIDLIISDNRYGLHHKSVKSVFISHQLNIQTPFFFRIANRINKKLIHFFDEVWVPDYGEENLRLSGRLSDPKGFKIPVKFIGPKSALLVSEKSTAKTEIDYLILLSGVEPQRMCLEKILIHLFSVSHKKIVLVRGSDKDLKIDSGNIKIIDFSYGDELRELIVNAKTVICRSGYSTLMDLHLLKKEQLILIPTPGQTEQIYLGHFWAKKFNATIIEQGKLNRDLKTHLLLEQ